MFYCFFIDALGYYKGEIYVELNKLNLIFENVTKLFQLIPLMVLPWIVWSFLVIFLECFGIFYEIVSMCFDVVFVPSRLAIFIILLIVFVFHIYILFCVISLSQQMQYAIVHGRRTRRFTIKFSRWIVLKIFQLVHFFCFKTQLKLNKEFLLGCLQLYIYNFE